MTAGGQFFFKEVKSIDSPFLPLSIKVRSQCYFLGLCRKKNYFELRPAVTHLLSHCLLIYAVNVSVSIFLISDVKFF